MGYDDLAPLLLIKYLLSGLNAYNECQHLVIDEGQDFGLEDVEESDIIGTLKNIIVERKPDNASFYIF